MDPADDAPGEEDFFAGRGLHRRADRAALAGGGSWGQHLGRVWWKGGSGALSPARIANTVSHTHTQTLKYTNARARTHRKNRTHARRTELTAAAAAAAQCRLRCLLIRPV